MTLSTAERSALDEARRALNTQADTVRCTPAGILLSDLAASINHLLRPDGTVPAFLRNIDDGE